ncbi:MAG: transketolase [Phycisphaerales bacterium]|nr:transketolase [Phycisphaerales bacterium]
MTATPTASLPTFRTNAGTPSGTAEIDNLAINTIRTLSMDGVQAAESGHPGTPMALAPVAYALWQQELVYDPKAPHWANRDRFVLSNGHASMLLYSLIHLAGIEAPASGGGTKPALSIDDLRQFRQLGSMTPGHPEYHHTVGVETTTGPLGQGLATSVGMAIASDMLGARYNRPGYPIFDFRVWSICGDGCMMEGISGEAASLAGHLGLSNLCWIYDFNHITIEGNTSLAYSDDVATRFLGYGWNVLRVGDANDLPALHRAYEHARGCTDRPTLIIVDSHIGWGSPKRQDTKEAHGEALGVAEIAATKAVYGWPTEPTFFIPEGVAERFDELLGARGGAARAAWDANFAAYANAYPMLAKEVEHIIAGTLPDGWDSEIPVYPTDAKGDASRNTGGKVLNAIAKKVPWIAGGSADLAPSTKTTLTFEESGGGFGRNNRAGRNMHFGIREHAMAAAMNGMTLSGLRAFGSGFLIFSDYARGSIRLGALMGIPVMNIFTHDSIWVGEDGPTHEPIEQLIGLRSIPNMDLYRPCDANEVAECFKAMMMHTDHASTIALTRQNLPTIDRTRFRAANLTQKGGYVLAESDGVPQIMLIASGSEVHLALGTHERLVAEGVRSRVVSLPCWSLFDRQDSAYRESVLPRSVRARVTVETGSTVGWDRFAGLDGEMVGMHSYGASGKGAEVAKHFGFTVDTVYAAAKRVLAAAAESR